MNYETWLKDVPNERGRRLAEPNGQYAAALNDLDAEVPMP